MERSRTFAVNACRATALLLATMSLTSSGCAPLLSSAVYLWQGGNVVPAECDKLEDQRVVVLCRPPASQEYSHASVSPEMSQKISELLVENVDGIDVVNPSEVDNWIDTNDWDNFKDLAKAVNADKVLYVELNDFNLYEGKTLYRGHTDVEVRIYDMKDKGKVVWERHLGEILYPMHSGIPAQDKPQQQFEREFVSIVATRIGEYFYKHDPNSAFAMDALATR